VRVRERGLTSLKSVPRLSRPSAVEMGCCALSGVPGWRLRGPLGDFVKSVWRDAAMRLKRRSSSAPRVLSAELHRAAKTTSGPIRTYNCRRRSFLGLGWYGAISCVTRALMPWYWGKPLRDAHRHAGSVRIVPVNAGGASEVINVQTSRRHCRSPPGPWNDAPPAPPIPIRPWHP